MATPILTPDQVFLTDGIGVYVTLDDDLFALLIFGIGFGGRCWVFGRGRIVLRLWRHPRKRGTHHFHARTGLKHQPGADQSQQKQWDEPRAFGTLHYDRFGFLF